MRYKSVKEVDNIKDLNKYLGAGYDYSIIATRIVRKIESDGSFEEKLIYTLGQPLQDEDMV